MSVKPIDINAWTKENNKYLIPPVCNKLMHNSQLKVQFVGGPNQRKDYHLEEGEEFFYMIEGDMCLKVIEKGKHKDVIIKEGEVFLLPAKIPHSPQRKENTLGLVIERERLLSETDALLYFIDGTTDILFERWFYCENLGTQLVPIIKEFFSSNEYKTGKPNTDSIKMLNPPYNLDLNRDIKMPFHLDKWLETYDLEINEKGFKSLFGKGFKSHILVYGGNKTHHICNDFETFLWQKKNVSHLQLDSMNIELNDGNTILINRGISCTLRTGIGSYTIAVDMPAHVATLCVD